MAKQEIIQNIFDGTLGGQIDKIDKKYLRYVQDFQGAAVEDAVTAFRTKDISIIERTLKKLAESRNTASFLIGIGAVIIEREKLYRMAGYNSYIEYTQHLFEELNIPVSTLSDDKIIMEKYIDYYKLLCKAGFRLERNANKLRYLDDALENHSEEEVFNRIVTDNFRTFRDWAQRPNLIMHKPGPETRVDVKIEGDKFILDGKDTFKFNKNISDKIKSYIKNDLTKTFTIREGGNDPFIIETYGTGEQTAIMNFLKKLRAKK
jgi:predicted MPP superfamily phosphohydrolase